MTYTHQTFDAMTPEQRRNLVRLAYWLDPVYRRQKGEHLIGPEYQALIDIGVVNFSYTDAARGHEVTISDLGRAVLRHIEGGL